MSNPTSNFGWQMPTNSDLVTDLPADFEVFGQAVDTSLADLKGGTTGQILSKASGTDMDFTWINNDQGDITGVTAGTGLTGGGTSGSVTLDFDVANYGGGQYAAGKNKIINGDFCIWQRGTSFASASLFQYTADRWFGNSFAGVTFTVSQQSFTAGAAPVSGYEAPYYLRCVRGAGSVTNTSYLEQRIEDVRTYAGQTVTLSFWAKLGTAGTITVASDQNFGSGGSSTVNIAPQNVSVTTSWARYSVNITLPSISGKTIGTGSYVTAQFALPVALGNCTFDIWGVQLEAGATATSFQTATGTLQGELAACQRYYWRRNSATAYGAYGTGSALSTTEITCYIKHPISMRTSTTTIEYANLQFSDGVNNITPVNLVGAQATNEMLSVYDNGIAGATQFRPYVLRNANNANGYFGVSAEL